MEVPVESTFQLGLVSLKMLACFSPRGASPVVPRGLLPQADAWGVWQGTQSKLQPHESPRAIRENSEKHRAAEAPHLFLPGRWQGLRPQQRGADWARHPGLLGQTRGWCGSAEASTTALFLHLLLFFPLPLRLLFLAAVLSSVPCQEESSHFLEAPGRGTLTTLAPRGRLLAATLPVRSSINCVHTLPVPREL